MQESNLAINATNEIDQAQFEADKRAVYKHPLFSLLALLLEKCEQATQGYLPNLSIISSDDLNNSNDEEDNFSKDIQTFVQLLEKEKRPLLTNNSELDGLMIKALQVLRIHLLELEKVQELCRDFCTRYIACLRGKMQSENLLRTDYPLESNNNLSNSNSPTHTSEQDHHSISDTNNYFSNNDFILNVDGNGFSDLRGSYKIPHNNLELESTYNNSLIQAMTNKNRESINFNSQQTSNVSTSEQTGSASFTNGNSKNQSQVVGSTSIDSNVLNLDQYSGQLSPSGSSDEVDSEIDSYNDDLSSNFSNDSNSKRKKRGILPKNATSVMRTWLFQHLVHPYPTEDEKRAIAAQTNLTLLQVNNWFINARRRIIQPMLENTSDNCNNTESI